MKLAFFTSLFLVCLLFCLFRSALGGAGATASPLPVRGLHLLAPAPGHVPLLASFIRKSLPQEGVNLLVLEINYRFQFRSHPELADENPLSEKDVKKLVSACREAGVQLIPLLNCLGHQSWAEKTLPLLALYPEFDETPGLFPNNKDIYCRSYCPRHPKLHEVLFALVDELASAFESQAFHVGMDEVFLLGEQTCPRCKGVDKAELFAEEVRRLSAYLTAKGLTLWMWGDRLVDGETSGIGKWEASMNETAPAVHKIPQDIVICDWHYEFAPPTAGYFALLGFKIVASPWRKADVAVAQLEQINWIRQKSNPNVASRALGVLQTTWTNPAHFIRAYHGDPDGEQPLPVAARESAACFKQLFAALRKF